jgi:HD-GYP domain-containing protein (c-di-GMP phosphodiesterase class II)
MNTPKSGPPTVTMDQLCIGLHIKLNSWLGHPFLFSSFKIRDQQQIDTLRSMGLSEIEYVPAKSDSKPLATPAPSPASTTLAPEAAAAALEELMQEKKERIETLNKERERIQQAEKKYVKTANTVKNVMRVANTHPAQAAAQSGEVASELVDVFLAEQNPYIHLMGDNVADESAYFHSLNVTVLSLILARAVGVDNFETMRDIAQGAILHDVGKGMIPSQVLLKQDDLTHAEQKLIEMHPGYGIKIMQPVDDLPRGVREIIFFHHEMLDGSGYPKGLKGDAIGQAVRIVTIANAYDNLCNQRVVARSKTPSEALSFMYKNELAKYDKAVLSAFVKSLGIYPPGTIVQLKSGKVGIVMSVDSADLLHPNLMIYDPAIKKDEAAVVNLRRDLDDAVERTLRPAALPPAVHDYLSPRKRICYFVDNSGQV